MIANLKQLRAKKKISQQQLADVIGISQQSINKYENHNVEPDISTLIDIADYFNTSVDYLIGHTDVEHIIENVAPYELNSDERTIIDGYRNLLPKEKQSIRLIIENYTKNRKTPGR